MYGAVLSLSSISSLSTESDRRVNEHRRNCIDFSTANTGQKGKKMKKRLAAVVAPLYLNKQNMRESGALTPCIQKYASIGVETS